MAEGINDKAWRHADKVANERWPLPKDTPGMVGTRTAMGVAIVLVGYDFLTPFMPWWAAALIVVGLSGAASYSDTLARWRNNSRCRSETYRLYKDHPDYQG